MMTFNQVLIFYSVALFLAAITWGMIIGQLLVQRPQSQRRGTWRTVVYSDVDVTKAVSFICQREDVGERFLSETRVNGDRFGTFYFARQIA